MTMQEVTSEWVSEAAPDPSACVGLSPGLGAVGHGMCQHPGTEGGRWWALWLLKRLLVLGTVLKVQRAEPLGMEGVFGSWDVY